jgi:hypothetical protein
MKLRDLKRIIKEEIKNIHEQRPPAIDSFGNPVSPVGGGRPRPSTSPVGSGPSGRPNVSPVGGGGRSSLMHNTGSGVKKIAINGDEGGPQGIDILKFLCEIFGCEQYYTCKAKGCQLDIHGEG